MRRRQVLALAAVGLTGCLSDSSPADATANGTTTSTTGTPTETTTDTPVSSTTDDSTATPNPPDIEAYPGDCPSYGENVTTVVCSDAAPDDVPLRMTASRSTVDLPATVEFTLSNDTHADLQTNHYAAVLHKRVEGEWFRVAPTMVNQPLTPIPAGERHTWRVELEHAPDREAHGQGLDERRVAGLGGGRYAFGNDGYFPGGSYEESTALATTVEVDVPPVELSRTDGVSDVSAEGDTVTALWNGVDAGEYTAEATFVLDETDGNADRRLVTEQVLQPGFGSPARPGPLRDALALLVDHEAGTARLTGTTSESSPFDLPEERSFVYEGTTYEMSAEKVEESE